MEKSVALISNLGLIRRHDEKFWHFHFDNSLSLEMTKISSVKEFFNQAGSTCLTNPCSFNSILIRNVFYHNRFKKCWRIIVFCYAPIGLMVFKKYKMKHLPLILQYLIVWRVCPNEFRKNNPIKMIILKVKLSSKSNYLKYNVIFEW